MTIRRQKDVAGDSFFEVAFDDSEVKYRTLVETIHEGIGIVDPDERIIYCNSALAEIFEMPREELLGRTLFEFLDHNQQEIIRKQTSIRKTKRKSLYDLTITLQNGDNKDIAVSVSPVFDAAGNYRGAYGAVSDVTERKKAVESLREKEKALTNKIAYLNTLIENMNELFFTYDEDSIITFVNKKSRETLGFSPEEMTGRNIMNFIPPEYRALIREKIRLRLHTGRSENYETVFFHKDGSRRNVKLSTSAIVESGKITGGMVLAEDVTERRQVEEQLKYLSLHDTLTGLYNRTCFEQEVLRLQECGVGLSGIILCDVDGLKLVNDTLGHDSGDTLLKLAAGIIRDSFRAGDMVARIGGDEFAVLLLDSNLKTVEDGCRRINLGLEDYNKNNMELPISISVGFAVGDLKFSEFADIYKEADNNMYRVKLLRNTSARSAIVKTLMKALEARDFITEGHGERLQELVKPMAVAMGINIHKQDDLRLFAQFHDIGKVGIPDRILFKKGPLTNEEMIEMQRHSEVGHRIARSAPELTPIADWILKHHEWWNGQGYPLGLKNVEIPVECRILAIADAYDAMTSDRPYREAMSRNQAVAELVKFAGIQFDPGLVAVFVNLLEKHVC